MAGPRRVIIEADYYADGIWWVPTKEEREGPPSSYLTRMHLRPWPLSQELRDDLKVWNRSWDDSDGFWENAEARRVWQEQGRGLAIRVQNELGTDGWEVLYRLDGWIHRVHPPGSWPAETWMQDLLGYTHPDPREAAGEEARVLEFLQKDQQETGADGSTPAEP